ncbi:MAG: hypothetical protein GX366_04465 [Epulopiscium sp.]|nr:hypothetical protein [Candidatus Epulonipiscium sp.]
MIVNSKGKKGYLGRSIILLLVMIIIGLAAYYFFIINKEPTQGVFVYNTRFGKEVVVDGYLHQPT